MQQTITEFFELIYEATKQQLPQFLVEHHNFQVRAALRNPDFADPDVVAREHQYQNMLGILVANYHKVSAIMAATPEPIQWAMLTLLGNSVESMTEQMNLEPQVRTTIMGGLADVLNNHEGYRGGDAAGWTTTRANTRAAGNRRSCSSRTSSRGGSRSRRGHG